MGTQTGNEETHPAVAGQPLGHSLKEPNAQPLSLPPKQSWGVKGFSGGHGPTERSWKEVACTQNDWLAGG